MNLKKDSYSLGVRQEVSGSFSQSKQLIRKAFLLLLLIATVGITTTIVVPKVAPKIKAVVQKKTAEATDKAAEELSPAIAHLENVINGAGF